MEKLNAYWWVAITSECMLNYNTGMVHKQGSPFARLRKELPKLPRKKIHALFWIEQLANDNDFPLTEYFKKYMVELHKEYKIEWV